MSSDLERGRRLARRRFAWISFGIIILITAAIMLGLLFHSDPVAFGQAVASVTGILTTILWVFTTLILGYLGVSVAEKIFTR